MNPPHPNDAGRTVHKASKAPQPPRRGGGTLVVDAFIGDLVWQLEGITQREERPWITRKRADSDAEGTRENLLYVIAIKERLPELIIVPAHDMRAFAEMPMLSQASDVL